MKFSGKLETRLENCMPEWLDRIHNAKNVADLLKVQRFQGIKPRLDIKDSTCCIVGEIYCFTASYVEECDDCDDYSMKFMNIIQASKTWFSKRDQHFNDEYKDELEYILRGFITHLRLRHPKVYAKCKCKVEKQ